MTRREKVKAVIVEAARRRGPPVTYLELAQRAGCYTARSVHCVLDEIGDRSMAEHGFRLDALVVRKKGTKGPGPGFDKHVPPGEDRTLFVRRHQGMAFQHYSTAT
jgi:hypothetical protein